MAHSAGGSRGCPDPAGERLTRASCGCSRCPTPGDTVQLDVKVIKINGKKAYQYTAWTTARVLGLRLYRELTQRSNLDYLWELRRALPFPLRHTSGNHNAGFGSNGTSCHCLPAFGLLSQGT